MPLDLQIPTNGLIVCEVWGLLFGQQTRTRFCYENTSGGPLSILTEAVPAFQTDHLTKVLETLSGSFSVWNIRGDAYNAQPTPTARGFRDTPVNMVGQDGSGSCPPTVAMVLRRRVGTVGRANRGRVYLPGVPVSGQANGMVAGVQLTAMNDLAVALGLDVVPEGEVTPIMKPVLVKRNEVGNVVSWQDIAYWDFDPILRSQRRREIGVGI